MFEEMVYLKEKVDAGAAFVITQMFLDAQVFLDFVQDGIDRIFIDATFQLYSIVCSINFCTECSPTGKECRKYEIHVPIVPGIMCLNGLGLVTVEAQKALKSWVFIVFMLHLKHES